MKLSSIKLYGSLKLQNRRLFYDNIKKFIYLHLASKLCIMFAIVNFLKNHFCLKVRLGKVNLKDQENIEKNYNLFIRENSAYTALKYKMNYDQISTTKKKYLFKSEGSFYFIF